MIGALLSQFWPYVVAAGGAIVALLGVYAKGRKDANARAAQKAAETYIETRKRMDETDTPDDADAADRWLRDRSER